MVSNPTIISDLRVIMEAGHTLELLTVYKGVPFICKSTIEEIQDDVVRIKTHDPAIVCLEDDCKPRVLGSDYFEPSIAQILSIDILAGVIEMGNFSYVGTKLGERMLVRVVPKGTIPVNLEIDRRTTSGQLADISMSGIGVRIISADYTPTLKPGTLVEISLELPTGKISLAGTVLSASKVGDAYRLSIRFNQDSAQRTRVFRYLVDRRVEIEKELLQDYNLAVETAKRASSDES